VWGVGEDKTTAPQMGKDLLHLCMGFPTPHTPYPTPC